MVDKELKNMLEKAYEKSAAQFKRDIEKLKKIIPDIKKRNYSALESVFKSLENEDFKFPTKEQFEKIPTKELEESIKLLSSNFIKPPDLKKSRFITVKSKGSSAAYYMQTDLNEKDCITVTMLRFHKVGAEWKRDNLIYSSSFAKKPTEKDNQEAILKEIETNPQFKI